MCVEIHQSVAKKSLQFKAELSRHNYVTPTSYLELLGLFSTMIKKKKNEISTQRNRTKSGLDKVPYHVVSELLIILCNEFRACKHVPECLFLSLLL